jgi:hypothetical protein
VLRTAAGTAYLVGTAKGFEVVIGFTPRRDVLAETVCHLNRAGAIQPGEDGN